MGNQGSYGFFKPKPLGYAFKTEERIKKWFKKRGVENVGRVWIDPEPKDYLRMSDCEALLDDYARGIKKCTLFGRQCEGARTRHLLDIYMECGIKIKPPPGEDPLK